MVFEDITKHGYEMKAKQLDYEESKVVFAKLARWHAASMCLVDAVRYYTTVIPFYLTYFSN